MLCRGARPRVDRHRSRPGRPRLVVPPRPAGDRPPGARRQRRARRRLAAPLGLADDGRRARRSPTCPAPPAPRRGGRANVVLADWFAAYEREHDLPVVRPVAVDRVTGDGDLLVVHAGDRSWTTRTARQLHRHLDPAVRAALPGRRDLPRRAAAHRRLPGPRALPRPPGAGRRRRRLGHPAARRDRPGRRHRLGDPPAAGVAVRRLRPRGRPGRGGAGGGPGTPRPPAGQRRQRHRAGAPGAGARGRAAGRLRAPADVRPHRARRGALVRRLVRAGGRDPLGHRLPAGGRPPRAAAAALACTAGSSSTAPPRSPTPGCSWSATGRRRARSAPTGPGARPPSPWRVSCAPRPPEPVRPPRWRRRGGGTPRTRPPRRRRSRARRPAPGA